MSTEPRKEEALARCEESIQWYKDEMTKSRRYFQWCQFSAIILAAVTPVLVVLQTMFEGQQVSIVVLIALFPALTAILTALNASFQWRENWIRFGATAEALMSERVKFRTRSTKEYSTAQSDQKALENFIIRIETMRLGETAAWQLQRSTAPDIPAAVNMANSVSQQQEPVAMLNTAVNVSDEVTLGNGTKVLDNTQPG